MQRYFVTNIQQDMIYLEKEDGYHSKKVMRNRPGDSLICIDTMGTNYLCKIVDIETGKLQICETIENDTELDVKVTLIYALPKKDKFEWVLQKATELGVSNIVPLQANRCVVKAKPEAFTKKKVRYQKILKEASEQSGRNVIPIVEDVISVEDMATYLGTYNLVAYEEAAKEGEHTVFSTVLQQLQPNDSVTIVVGCEGGFTAYEIEAMQRMGFISCSLGKRILRSETAPMYMLSAIGYMRELGDRDEVI